MPKAERSSRKSAAARRPPPPPPQPKQTLPPPAPEAPVVEAPVVEAPVVEAPEIKEELTSAIVPVLPPIVEIRQKLEAAEARVRELEEWKGLVDARFDKLASLLQRV